MLYIDFEIWSKKYKITWEKERHKHPIIYEDSRGKIKEEVSPYFENCSKAYLKKGKLNKEEFKSICNWKTERQKGNYDDNKCEDVESTTEKIIELFPHTKSQIKELINLKGVGVAVASAILTVLFPKYYCIIDYRAWRALNYVNGFSSYSDYAKFLDRYDNRASVDSYIKYFESIKNLPTERKMTPRKIEMALWQYDKEKGNYNDL